MSLTHNIFARVNRPVGRSTLQHLILAFILFCIPVFLFAFIADEVLEGDTLPYDDKILLGIYHHASTSLNHVIVTLTQFGGVGFVLGIAMAVVGVLIWREKWQSATQVAAGVLGAGALNLLLKLTFERDRPNLWEHIVTETTYSFPSGHAMLSSALAFSLVAILWHTKWRWTAISIGSIYILVIGFTRLYLGVHYPTDVFAGWLVSFAWVILVGAVLGAVRPRYLLDKYFFKRKSVK